jgi:uncharacterized protein YndB with AHSA1/START domain
MMTAATNSPGSTTFTMPSDVEIAMSRVFDAPRRLLWDAWTNPDHVPQWMTGPEGWTMPVCEIDLRPGGAWHFVWRRANGAEMAMDGKYLEVEPPSRLVMTETWGKEWPETVNTLTLVESNGRTTMTQTMRYPSKAARDAAFQTGMQDGASVSFERLAKYLEELRRAS